MIEIGTQTLTLEELREFSGLENLSDEELTLAQKTVYAMASALVSIAFQKKIEVPDEVHTK